MQEEANIEHKGKQTEKGNNESNDLPVNGVATVGLDDVGLGVGDEQEPENGGTEVLDGDAPVEGEGWLPPLYLAAFSSAELGHGVGKSSDAAHSDFGVPLLEWKLGNNKGGN